MEDKTILRETFGESPIIRTIDFLMDNPLFDYSKEEMIKNLGISKATFYKYFPLLESNDILEFTRKVGKSKMYKLNGKSEVVKKLRELVWALGIRAMEKAAEQYRKPIAVKSV